MVKVKITTTEMYSYTHQRHFDKLLLIINTNNLVFLSKNKEHKGDQNQMHIKFRFEAVRCIINLMDMQNI